jgi:hypothetical protein
MLRTELVADVRREPARRGKRLRVEGRLLVARSDSSGFSPYSRREVVIQFRAKGPGRFRAVARVRTASDGSFDTGSRLKARRTGEWRVIFVGDRSHHASTSLVDLVRVLRRPPKAGGFVLS